MQPLLEDQVKEIAEAITCSLSACLILAGGLRYDNPLIAFIGATMLGLAGFRYAVQVYSKNINY